MSANVLVINSGSSSIKYQLVDATAGTALAGGSVERIGEVGSNVHHDFGGARIEREVEVIDHRGAMAVIVALFDEVGPGLDHCEVVAVGHRVVMGGTEIDGPVLVDDALLATVQRLSPLAPLHNPANLTTMQVAVELFPDLPHVAVFDTAFFHGLPAIAATYALNRAVAERHGIRRYGFHGTSHQYVSEAAAKLLGRGGDETLRQIVLHLGNGASASAVVGGRPVETSMGMTPLEGLVMGTRTGDIDPAVAFHLARAGAMSVDEIDRLFNQESGMVGLTGHKDMREVHRLAVADDEPARLALEIYAHRLRKYIGAYAAVMGGLDALTFTAGVGENDATIRSMVAQGLGFLGISVDPARNDPPRHGSRLISPDGSPVAVLVIPTNEELSIARQVLSLL